MGPKLSLHDSPQTRSVDRPVRWTALPHPRVPSMQCFRRLAHGRYSAARTSLLVRLAVTSATFCRLFFYTFEARPFSVPLLQNHALTQTLLTSFPCVSIVCRLSFARRPYNIARDHHKLPTSTNTPVHRRLKSQARRLEFVTEARGLRQ